MEVQKEREAFQKFCEENFDFEHHEQTYFDEQTQCYENDIGEDTESINMAWMAWQSAKAQAVPEGFAIKDVINERQRQINQEFYSTENDDEYKQNELLRAAVCYAENVVRRGWVFDSNFGPDVYQEEEVPDLWPWDLDFWKPRNPRRDLVRAAALLIAEIERIDRSTGANP
ncbi:hypothetical protein [Acinetobacter johnsonii]|uniref:hypothetical protein n=1 Tax=Acinetobacter johnsonii TaxID=40214 RepID=UPI000B0061E2|nr:hypothetical protein [Acinetobacter johnsonii]